MAIRFKNGGDGTTAEGAILVANPDEFRDALNYQDENASTCIKYIELEADLDLNYSVDWYYRMKDIFNVNALKNISNSNVNRRIIINGMGHSITNIYVYPNCAVFGTNSDNRQSGSAYGCVFEINDITFEAIIQKGGGFFSGSQARQSWPESQNYRMLLIPRTNGCIFNIKFDNSYDYSLDYMYLFDYSVNNYTSEGGYSYARAINCIFNIYISAQSVDHRPLFKCSSGSQSDFGLMTVFESCEFRIRNNTDKLICIFELKDNTKFLIDNCAIFFADIKQYDDPDQRTSKFSKGPGYVQSSDVRHLIGRYSSYIGYVKALFYNSYIAAFGNDFNSGHNDPIYFWLDCTDTNQIIPATSFYDKSKIFIGAGYDDTTAQTTGFSALTTTQCKDKTTLSNIGYLFAEEV